MPELTDTQRVILAGAAQRADGFILPLPKKLKLGVKAIEGVLPDLIKNKLVAEEPATDGSPIWRGTDGQPMALMITASGLRAIGAQEPKGGEAKNSPPRPARKPQGRKSSSRSTHALRRDKVRRSSRDTRPSPGSSRAVRGGSKQAKLVELLRRPRGASLSEMQKATGWQAHSVRGVMSGALKKKLGLGITSRKDESGERRYRIAR